jgi:cytochrome c peroxidase
VNESTDAPVRRRRLTALVVGLAVAASIAAIAVIYASDGGPAPDEAAAVERDPHRRVAVSKEILNAVDKVTLQVPEAELVAEGRDLFRSSEVALDGESCQSCHTDGGANKDVGTTPHGIPGQPIDQSFVGPRDPPTLFSVGRTDPYFWIGDVETLQAVSVATIQNHFKPAFKQPALTQQQVAEMAAAITAYMETIAPPTTDFDRGTMSEAAQRGLELFQGKAGCVECHGGPEFTDNLIHNTLVPQAPPMFAGAPANNDHGAKQPPAGSPVCPNIPINPLEPLECGFNTPTLRGNGLLATAPYMHNGVFSTLEQVVSFYNTQSSVAPLNLTAQEQADLVALLKEL